MNLLKKAAERLCHSEDDESLAFVKQTRSAFHSLLAVLKALFRNDPETAEPLLFHWFRQKIEDADLGDTPDADTERDALEEYCLRISSEKGLVDVSRILHAMTPLIVPMAMILSQPTSQSTQSQCKDIGLVKSLGPTRLCIIDFLIEVLHASKSAMACRDPESGPLYNEDGCLQGGRAGLESLAHSLSPQQVDDSTSQSDQASATQTQSTSSEIHRELVTSGVVPIIVSLYFDFPLHSIMQSAIVRIFEHILIGHKTLASITLAQHLIFDSRLLSRLCDAYSTPGDIPWVNLLHHCSTLISRAGLIE